MSVDREIQVLLAEYQALRNEADHYSQRIDKMSAVYLTVLFAVSGYLIRPESKFNLDMYLQKVEASPALSGFFLLVSVLNSVLLIRIGSFYLGLLSITQYTHYKIRPYVTKHLGSHVLNWDEAPTTGIKKNWLPMRSIGQLLFFALSEAISILIVVQTAYVLGSGVLLSILYVVCVGCLGLSFWCLYKMVRSSRDFHGA